MPTALGDGVRIHYLEQGNGPLVLFLHGVGSGSQHWRAQLEALGDSFHVAAWDARGYGGSDNPPRPITQRDFAADVNALLDHFGAARAHLCGLSMGGMIAQMVYRAYPRRVRSLILADTLPGFGSLPNKEAALAERLQAIDSLSLTEGARQRTPMLLRDNPDPRIVELMVEHMATLRPQPYRQAWVSMFEVDYTDLLPQVRVPSLIICGREDKVTPLAESEKMHRLIPGSRLVILENAGHLTNLEQPAEFNRVVREFLLGVEANAG